MIPTKEKRCKGRGLAAGQGCGELKYHFKYGLCKPCYAHFLFHTPEGQYLVKKVQEKVKLQIKENRNKKIHGLYYKKRKPNIKLQDKQFDEIKLITQIVCNEYIRARDRQNYNNEDISGNGKIHDAGHYINIGANGGIIRYSPQNIHGQCARDNRWKGGNKGEYRSGLIHRYGLGYVEEIEDIHYSTMKDKTLDKELVLRIHQLYKDLLKKEQWIYRHVEFLKLLNLNI